MTENFKGIDREREREDALALVGWVGYRNLYFMTISLSLSLSLFLTHISLIIHSSLHEEQKEEEKSFFLF